MENYLFYSFGGLAVLTALLMVTRRNPVMSALSLVGCLFCLAALYVILGAHFVGAAQILVYAGAIMVLFLFVIMLLNLGSPASLKGLDTEVFTKRRIALPLAISGALLALGLVAIERPGGLPTDPALSEQGIDSTSRLAAALFGRFLLPFEASSVLLLATAVGVIVLAKRERRRPVPEDPS